MPKRPETAKTVYSKFNGDERREKASQGFDAKRKAEGLKVVHGTRRADEDPRDQEKVSHKFVPASGASMNVARIGPNNGLG